MFARFSNIYMNVHTGACDNGHVTPTQISAPSTSRRLNAFSISLRDFFKIKAYKNKRLDERAIMFHIFMTL